MNCCPECFVDVEIRGFINSNSNSNGTCDFCSTKNTPLINVQELQGQFSGLLDIYVEDDDGKVASVQIQEDWRIFKLTDNNKIKKMLLTILDGMDNGYQKLLDSPVRMSISSDTDDLLKSWQSFKKEIKRENRFFLLNKANLDAIEETLPFRTYVKGKIFYRCRISDNENGYPKEQMGKPHPKSSREGRANPKGIPYLYVTQSEQTSLYEARVTYLDYATIADFRLKENINVITLRTTYQVSPFLEDFSIEKYIKNKTFIDLLEEELSKPLRRYDDELDYLPTQYLCEYIKHLGYDGVEFGSAMHEEGINLVIFNDEKLEIVRTRVFEVSKIEINSVEIVKK